MRFVERLRVVLAGVRAPRMVDGMMTGHPDTPALYEVHAPRWWQFARLVWLMLHEHVILLAVPGPGGEERRVPAVMVGRFPGLRLVGSRHRRQRR